MMPSSLHATFSIGDPPGDENRSGSIYRTSIPLRATEWLHRQSLIGVDRHFSAASKFQIGVSFQKARVSSPALGPCFYSRSLSTGFSCKTALNSELWISICPL
jgi:hypothetical protein